MAEDMNLQDNHTTNLLIFERYAHMHPSYNF
jgi:hypothetical protein